MEDRVVQNLGVIESPAPRRRLPEDPPGEEADVDRVDEWIDEEEPEDGDRDEREAVTPAGLAQAGAAQRGADAAWRSFGRGRGRHRNEIVPCAAGTAQGTVGQLDLLA